METYDLIKFNQLSNEERGEVYERALNNDVISEEKINDITYYKQVDKKTFKKFYISRDLDEYIKMTTYNTLNKCLNAKSDRQVLEGLKYVLRRFYDFDKINEILRTRNRQQLEDIFIELHDLLEKREIDILYFNGKDIFRFK